MKTPMALALTLLASMPLHAQTDHEMPKTDPASGGKPRSFNFNADRPFINASGVPDLATMQFHTDIISTEIADEGSCARVKGLDQDGKCLGHVVHIKDPNDNLPTTRVALLASDSRFSPTAAYRTQMSSFYVDAKRKYVLDIEFKLDEHWDFDMKGDADHPVGSGLIWQLKSVVKLLPEGCQHGSPSMALNLIGKRLNFSVSYPKAALEKQVWPTEVCWKSGYNDDGYVRGNSWDVTINSGVYHHAQFIFYADDAPNKPINDPVQPEGKGYVIATMDGQPWFQYAGPTLLPDQPKRHQMSWGWYQWSGMPDEGRSNRIIYFRQMRLRDWND